MFQTSKYIVFISMMANFWMRSPDLSAADDSTYMNRPFALIAAAGVDRVEEDLTRLATVSENVELLKKYQLLKNIAKTLPGVDYTRPFGASLIFHSEQLDSPALLAFLPVTDGELLMESLQQRFRIIKTIGERHWQAKLPDVRLFIFLKGKYLLISQVEEVPANVTDEFLSNLEAKTSEKDITAWLDFEGLSESNRQELLRNIFKDLSKEGERKADESDEEFSLRRELIEILKTSIQHIVKDSHAVSAGLQIESAINLEVQWNAKPATELAKQFNELPLAETNHSFQLRQEVPFQARLAINFPRYLKAYLLDFLKVAREQIKKEIGPKLAAADRGPVSGIFNAVHDTVQKGELNATVAFEEAGENEMIFLGAMKIEEEDLIVNFLKAILPYAGESDDVSEVEIDFYDSENITLHRLRGESQRADDRRLYGEGAALFVGTGREIFWIANGGETTPSKLEKINEDRGLSNSGNLAAATFSLDPWLRLAEKHQQDMKKIKVIRQAFPDSNDDKLQFEIKSVENALSATFHAEQGYFKLLGVAIKEEQRKKQAVRKSDN